MNAIPPGIRVAVSEIVSVKGDLIGDEYSLVEATSSARRNELISGRVLVHRLMIEMGSVPSQIMQRANGAPIWPIGLSGSISHSATHIAVALARSSLVPSIGIDIEDGRNLGAAANDVGTPDEILGALAHPCAIDRNGAVRLLFSGKEAFYKCQAPLTGHADLDWLDIRLEFKSSGLIQVQPSTNLNRMTTAAAIKTNLIIQEEQGVILAIAWLRSE